MFWVGNEIVWKKKKKKEARTPLYKYYKIRNKKIGLDIFCTHVITFSTKTA